MSRQIHQATENLQQPKPADFPTGLGQEMKEVSHSGSPNGDASHVT